MPSDEQKPLRPPEESLAEINGHIAAVHSAANARLLSADPELSLASLVYQMQQREVEDHDAREASEPDWYHEEGKRLKTQERRTEGEHPGLLARELGRTFGAGSDQAAAA